eukprot:gene7921-9409_t
MTRHPDGECHEVFIFLFETPHGDPPLPLVEDVLRDESIHHPDTGFVNHPLTAVRTTPFRVLGTITDPLAPVICFDAAWRVVIHRLRIRFAGPSSSQAYALMAELKLGKEEDPNALHSRLKVLAARVNRAYEVNEPLITTYNAATFLLQALPDTLRSAVQERLNRSGVGHEEFTTDQMADIATTAYNELLRFKGQAMKNRVMMDNLNGFINSQAHPTGAQPPGSYHAVAPPNITPEAIVHFHSYATTNEDYPTYEDLASADASDPVSPPQPPATDTYSADSVQQPAHNPPAAEPRTLDPMIPEWPRPGYFDANDHLPHLAEASLKNIPPDEIALMLLEPPCTMFFFQYWLDDIAQGAPPAVLLVAYDQRNTGVTIARKQIAGWPTPITDSNDTLHARHNCARDGRRTMLEGTPAPDHPYRLHTLSKAIEKLDDRVDLLQDLYHKVQDRDPTLLAYVTEEPPHAMYVGVRLLPQDDVATLKYPRRSDDDSCLRNITMMSLLTPTAPWVEQVMRRLQQDLQHPFSSLCPLAPFPPGAIPAPNPPWPGYNNPGYARTDYTSIEGAPTFVITSSLDSDTNRSKSVDDSVHDSDDDVEMEVQHEYDEISRLICTTEPPTDGFHRITYDGMPLRCTIRTVERVEPDANGYARCCIIHRRMEAQLIAQVAHDAWHGISTTPVNADANSSDDEDDNAGAANNDEVANATLACTARTRDDATPTQTTHVVPHQEHGAAQMLLEASYTEEALESCLSVSALISDTQHVPKEEVVRLTTKGAASKSKEHAAHTCADREVSNTDIHVVQQPRRPHTRPLYVVALLCVLLASFLTSTSGALLDHQQYSKTGGTHHATPMAMAMICLCSIAALCYLLAAQSWTRRISPEHADTTANNAPPASWDAWASYSSQDAWRQIINPQRANAATNSTPPTAGAVGQPVAAEEDTYTVSRQHDRLIFGETLNDAPGDSQPQQEPASINPST